jgi:hypothetical protein
MNDEEAKVVIKEWNGWWECESSNEGVKMITKNIKEIKGVKVVMREWKWWWKNVKGTKRIMKKQK